MKALKIAGLTLALPARLGAVLCVAVVLSSISAAASVTYYTVNLDYPAGHAVTKEDAEHEAYCADSLSDRIDDLARDGNRLAKLSPSSKELAQITGSALESCMGAFGVIGSRYHLTKHILTKSGRRDYPDNRGTPDNKLGR